MTTTATKVAAGCFALVFGVFFIGFLAAKGAADRSGVGNSTAPSTRRTAVNTGSAAPAEALQPAVSESETDATVTFGKPTMKAMPGGMGTEVLVEVTNPNSHKVSCVVQATFKAGDTIIATASGAVNEIPPRGTRTAELITMEKVRGFDTVKLQPSACF